MAKFIPLAALLVVVCWNMAEKSEFARLVRHWPTAVVLLTTFGLILGADLTAGIIAGCLVAALLSLFERRVE
ncbi:MAG: hypothetical protein JNL45_04970 [Hyphomicrobium sp.]|nr:hypothetical protein [Hyphomicrobium sp.]